MPGTLVNLPQRKREPSSKGRAIDPSFLLKFSCNSMSKHPCREPVSVRAKKGEAMDDSKGRILGTNKSHSRVYSLDSEVYNNSDGAKEEFSSSKIIKDNDLKPELLMSKTHEPQDQLDLKLRGEYNPPKRQENIGTEEARFDGV